ncbi:hypothetical protein PspLS_05061 [Pyricularia sp. CBS 133598]|nr:hypothetical protein PspLS_05061 [Pyricularia sp. CBS 133598]
MAEIGRSVLIDRIRTPNSRYCLAHTSLASCCSVCPVCFVPASPREQISLLSHRTFIVGLHVEVALILAPVQLGIFACCEPAILNRQDSWP